MKCAGKARNNGLYRHIRTSKEIIRNLLNDYYNILGSELQDGDIWDLADTKKDIYSLWDRCPFYYAYLLILDGWN